MIADRPPALRGEAGGFVLRIWFLSVAFDGPDVGMTMRRAAALLVMLMLSCGALAADEPQTPPPAADTLHPPSAGEPAKESAQEAGKESGKEADENESWWQAILRAAPACKSFSDGCRQCDVHFQCSGLPIACQPREFTCADPKP